MDHSEKQLTYREIFFYWLPLAFTWLMMASEGPFISAIIARMGETKENLAAFGVAFALALLVESPIIMMLSASTALVEDWPSYVKLRVFAFSLNLIITVMMFLLLIPSIFDYLAISIINLPPRVAQLTYYCSCIMLPWPAAIGFRRFYQGLLIRFKQTRLVAYGTGLRLSSIVISSMFLYFKFPSLSGAYVGSISLSIAVTVEAVFSRLMVHPILANLPRESVSERSQNLNTSSIFTFYYPLALTAILMLGVNPIITFFLGQSRFALESLAVYPVVNSFSFIFRSVGISFQEISITLLNERTEDYEKLRRFSVAMSFILSAGLAIVAFTPLSFMWFHHVSGLTLELTHLAIIPVMILTAIPGLTMMLSFQRSVLVNVRKTMHITWATALEIIGIGVILYIGIYQFNMIGVTAATLAVTLGRLAANIYLIAPVRAVR